MYYVRTSYIYVHPLGIKNVHCSNYSTCICVRWCNFRTSQGLQDRATEIAKDGLKERIGGQADSYRAAMEIDRIKMDQSVRILNEAAFSLVEKEVRSGGPLGFDPPPSLVAA